MKQTHIQTGTALVLVLLLAASLAMHAQVSAGSNSAKAANTASIPRLVKFSGTVRDDQGQPQSGTVGITFALYKDQEGGAPLWLETQNVQPDSSGRYTIMLGAATADGLPVEFFTSNEAQWVGVQPQEQSEQPRILLVSAPYALKAADADTLGGKPASAYVTMDGQSPSMTVLGTNGNAGTVSPPLPGANGKQSPRPPSPCSVTTDGSGTSNVVSKFLSPCEIVRSAISESGGSVTLGGSGILNLPQTTSGVGIIEIGGSPFLHDCCSASADNSFVGANAGNFTTTGFQNAASGFDALHANTTGSENTATGYDALLSNTNGNSNTADGHEALINNINGFNNTAVGFSAMLDYGSGTDNTAMGQSVLNFNTTGSFNTAVGETALGVNTTGRFNTGIGYNANVGAGNLTNATAIGAHATAGASNTLVLGGTGSNAVNVGIGTSTPGATLEVDSPNQLGVWIKAPETGVGAGLDLFTTGSGGMQWEILNTGSNSAQGPNKLNIRNTGNDVPTILAGGQVGIATRTPDTTFSVNGGADKPGGGSWGTFSDRRLKTIQGSYEAGLSQILQFNPVRYRYRQENALGITDNQEHVGLVAQEVQKVIPEAVSANNQGYLLVNNDPIIWSMLNAIKQQQQQIQGQQTTMAKLAHELQSLRQVQAENADLRHDLARITAEVQQIRTSLQQEQGQSVQAAVRTSGN